MASIREALQDFNPWWSSGILKVDFADRSIYHEVKKFMGSRQIIALSGLRRVGKTTILLKIITDAMGDDFSPSDIIYFSFDEFKNVELREVIRAYEELAEKNLHNGRFLVLLDEVQKLDDWQNQLKAIYDQYGTTVKIVITGSESLFIRWRAKESLAGRIFEFRVEQLSFAEFLGFRKFNPEPIGMHEKDLIALFDKYIMTQGFPELANEENTEYIKKYISEGVVEKVLYSDIPKLFKISDITVLEAILRPLLEEPGQIIEFTGLSKELGISRQTLSLYLRYLEESFLVRKIYNFSRNRRKVERKLKKYYPAVVSQNLLLRKDDVSRSRAFEWIVVRLLNPEFFWRDAYKNEVDAIMLDNNTITPNEVKYGKIETSGLMAFMRHFKVNSGIIVSRNTLKQIKIDGKQIEIIPAYRFFANARR